MKPNECAGAGGGHPHRESGRRFFALQLRAAEVVQLVSGVRSWESADDLFADHVNLCVCNMSAH